MSNENIGKQLMKLFFNAPMVNGILVFEDNNYLGVVLKKDIERGLKEGNFELYNNINFIKESQLNEILFNKNNFKNATIPVIDKEGNLIRIISYNEYLCHFFFDEFVNHFDEKKFLNHLDTPLIITSYFKKIIYLNIKALDLFENDVLGKNINVALKSLEMHFNGKNLIVEKNKDFHTLLIIPSISKEFASYMYLFVKI